MTVKPRDTSTPQGIDPDAPLSDEEFHRAVVARLPLKARAATGLSQEAFAKQYGIPVGTVRDWEQARREPDAAAIAYLTIILKQPLMVADALHPRVAG